MENNQITKSKYNLEDRTLEFAKKVIRMCQKLDNNIINQKLMDQLVRSSGSVGANYREANDSLGKKDFFHRLRISRKETKETIFWLELVLEANAKLKNDIDYLIDEAIQIRNILSAIITKVTQNNE
ncbi:MAG TPA: four helix bundle protein [Candidatus Woesebacteria bacterium]|nr:four helix bundle protein [Candidatus Woesebacteria bacterium]HPJ16747.1 four helix bundle protein [Candidatus Woesebacteria bacterium]